MGSGRGWLARDWPSTGGVLNITAAAWTADFHRWRSGNITRTQNVSEYMLVLALCLVKLVFRRIVLSCSLQLVTPLVHTTVSTAREHGCQKMTPVLTGRVGYTGDKHGPSTRVTFLTPVLTGRGHGP